MDIATAVKMRFTLQDRLLRRELGDPSRYTTIKALYGDRAWIDDLDIVNELGGHSGCVNALSWSSSGRLLASGSDDQHLNIHTYQPESSVSQFSLSTTVATGHSANIFSVKFMPHSNDGTLVTCAGDSEVRVFDIDYSSRPSIPLMGSNRASSGWARFNNSYKGVRYLSHGDTSARVYRSHADRVKRIVTESSPFLFLTCSEDGEVRQFDLRLPSTAYPAPRGGRGFLSHRRNHDDSNVPPPLISYKRYHLDLNTISCSASQPHYIALGGAHLHCFLHDRRMLGRDLLEERGYTGSNSPAGSASSRENELMGQATQCVRKFAPNGRKRMQRTDNGHITACKISDANPNEMIVSWSGDHIYSFDLIKSPDASENTARDTESQSKGYVKGKMKESTDRKRKRNNQNPPTSLDAARRSSKSRQKNKPANDDGDLSIRVRYENGQSEDIAMDDHIASVPPVTEGARAALLTESHKRSLRIAKSVVKIRLLMFSLDTQTRALTESAEMDHTTLATQFTSLLGFAAACLPEMDEIISYWRYPLNPSTEDVLLQQTLRTNREASRRFVQAAGTLAKLLGGRLQTASLGPSHVLELFHHVGLTPREGPYTTQRQVFGYEFLKAIILWLDGGPQALLQGFKRPETQPLTDSRFPVPDNTQLSGVDDYVIPHLLQLAQENSIPNVDASRFERDADRQVFETEKAAVIAFSHAIRIPLEDLSTAVTLAFSSSDQRPLPHSQDRRTAMKFWGFKVGRGLLMTAAEGINFQFVDTAFGGLGGGHVDEGRVQDDIDPEEMEDVVESVSVLKRPANELDGATAESGETIARDDQINGTAQMDGSSSLSTTSREPTVEVEEIGSDAEVVLMDDIHNEIAHHMGENYEEENVSNDEDDEDGDRDEDDDDDDDDEITAEERQFLFQSASDRGKLRETVEKDVACSSHTRQYTGHCNVKTVKDANFFGLQDEYVVSGSDSGHLFIWDKRTSELVNILKGDEEVVNVVQGHPYEPLLAVSGIDNTIKIFSPDTQAQADARAGINIGSTSNDSSGYNSTSQRRRRARDDAANGSESGSTNRQGLTSRKCMEESYQITSQNDSERQGGMRDAFITRGMLAQLAARLQARNAAGGNGEGDGMPVVVDDNCAIM